MADSKIEWTDKAWNPVRGCSIVSAGCRNCYAMKQAHRFAGAGKPYDGLTQLSKNGPVWTGRARFVPEMLAAPLSWKKPQRIFVNSMSDLFHEDVADEDIAAVFGVMAACPWHTFQILTKRAERMRDWFEWIEQQGPSRHPLGAARGVRWYARNSVESIPVTYQAGALPDWKWPLPNVWLGVSVENQGTADERLPILLRTPAAMRFASMEPLLERVTFTWRLKSSPSDGPEGITWDQGLDWVIVGGESGPGARPFALEWGEYVVRQCKRFRVPVFFKQLGARPFMERLPEWHEHPGAGSWSVPLVIDGGRLNMRLKDRKGGDVQEFPPWLRVRQFPGVRHG